MRGIRIPSSRRLLFALNTIDERIHDLVMSKGAMSDALVDGVVQNKNDVIDYLLD